MEDIETFRIAAIQDMPDGAQRPVELTLKRQAGGPIIGSLEVTPTGTEQVGGVS
jgi:hypothetical protein